MKLRALLTLPDSRLELVTGRDGLDRPVRWVVTTDLPQPGRYLRGGELVLSGLMWRSGPADSEAFVEELAKAGVSALAGGLARGALPDDLVAACRRHRMPLFSVPEDVAFATVTEEVVRHLSGARDLTAVLDRHRRLVAGAGEGAGLGAVLDLVTRDVGLRCWVLTPTGRVVAGPEPPPAGGELAHAFLTAPRLPHPHDGVTIFPVAAETVPRAADWFLAFEGDARDWPPEHRALAAELAAIVALERARLDDRLSVEGRLAQELVRLVVSAAGAGEIASRLALAGLDAGASFTAVAASGRPPLRPAEVRAVLGEAIPVPRPVVGLLEEEVIALVPVPETEKDVADRIQAALAALAPGFTDGGLAVGVSDVVAAGELRGAVEEARFARRLAAQRADPVCVVRHDELATHVLLLASVPDDVRDMFRVRLLDPLRTYDEVHNADLVRTLETFLQNSGSWTRCAERLHLHVNSVRYRIQRIEELTGRDLSRLEDRVDFFLALRLG
ncbi:PucR family transcriptional regulator ligand-binding domain-containing protein [Actinomadura graeca]|uniref:PucR family transcriptional regulator ligand-binding domain-containing protein n=1 Tax=Actinomadura graeca TaxID=2750812 RepID=A0ABX8R434_9ACTN|nr:PucR family transcriptional regulator [Actinomadura graeca]QXJ24727.1 PucR family transcriptional regulator ligand-binding domain-containing protein [Actinomadura graeca]